VDVDPRQLIGQRLKNRPVVVDLHELSPVGGRAAGGRDWRRLERFAEVREDLPDRARIGDERDESDVAAAPRALQRKLLAHPSHEFGIWRREVSWEGGLSHEPQLSPGASPPAACPPLLPMNGEGRATQGQSKPLDSLVPTPAAEHPEAAVGAAGRTPFPARPRGAGQRWLAAVVTYAVARPA